MRWLPSRMKATAWSASDESPLRAARISTCENAATVRSGSRRSWLAAIANCFQIGIDAR